MSDEQGARESWGVCAGCSVCERAEKLNEDGLCFWCTPEGKAEAARRFGAGPDLVPRQPHEGALR